MAVGQPIKFCVAAETKLGLVRIADWESAVMRLKINKRHAGHVSGANGPWQRWCFDFRHDDGRPGFLDETRHCLLLANWLVAVTGCDFGSTLFQP